MTLEQAARKWWEMHRPVGWTLEQHLANPTINTTASEADRALARAVAKAIFGDEETKP